MTPEEKLKEAKRLYKTANADQKYVLERLFPALKKSEDEQMIQYFKDLVPFSKADELYEKYGCSHADAIAWIETQGAHKKFLDSIQVGDKVTRNEDGVLVNLSRLKRVAKKDEKQGEQKLVPDWMPTFLDELRTKKNYFDWEEHRDIEGQILAIIRWMNPNYFNEKDGEQKPTEVEPKFKKD